MLIQLNLMFEKHLEDFYTGPFLRKNFTALGRRTLHVPLKVSLKSKRNI
jgi:hypothetical protein